MYIRPTKIIGHRIDKVTNITVYDKETLEPVLQISEGFMETPEEYEVTVLDDNLHFEVDCKNLKTC